MKNWEKALAKFLKKYETDPCFEGAVLFGSYARGTQNEFSDIDVHILISDTQNYRERGVVDTDGFLIEYFINPLKQIRKEFHSDYFQGANTDAIMFAGGKILSDKNGNVGNLQDEAVSFLNKPLRKKKKEDVLYDLYSAWDLMDKLNSLAREGEPLAIVYYELAKKLSNLYFKIKGIPSISLTKTEKLFTNSDFAKKCNVKKLPDKRFISSYLSAVHGVDILKMQKLYDFVINAAGGFDITSFRMRSEVKD